VTSEEIVRLSFPDGFVRLGLLLAGLLLLPQPAAAQNSSSEWAWSSASYGLPAPLLQRGYGNSSHRPALQVGLAPAVRGRLSFPIENPLIALPQDSEEGSGWLKGLAIGGAIGMGVGLLAFLAVDATPCDSCSGVSDSAASGTGPEFVFGFGLVGGAIGALIGR